MEFEMGCVLTGVEIERASEAYPNLRMVMRRTQLKMARAENSSSYGMGTVLFRSSAMRNSCAVLPGNSVRPAPTAQ